MIKDFIKIFKNTYNEYNKEKLAAKSALSEMKGILYRQGDLCKDLRKIDTYLNLVYLHCPEHERQTIVQPLLDFLNYRYREVSPGPNNSESFSKKGYIKKMTELAMYCEDDLRTAKELYDKKEFKNCVEHVKNSIEYIKKEFEGLDAKFILPSKR